jgi:hypothetical protein
VSDEPEYPSAGSEEWFPTQVVKPGHPAYVPITHTGQPQYLPDPPGGDEKKAVYFAHMNFCSWCAALMPNAPGVTAAHTAFHFRVGDRGPVLQ